MDWLAWLKAVLSYRWMRTSSPSISTTGNNTAIGFAANVSTGNLSNATAIGNGAIVNNSNKIRLGNTAVTVIERQVAFTFPSYKTKRNFKPVDGEAILGKIRGFELTSWNFISHDPQEFRHYGPMAQDFYAAFGHAGVGQIGSETTINSGDMGRDSDDRGASAGEAHGGAKTHEGIACCNGRASGGVGVAKPSLHPDRI